GLGGGVVGRGGRVGGGRHLACRALGHRLGLLRLWGRFGGGFRRRLGGVGHSSLRLAISLHKLGRYAGTDTRDAIGKNGFTVAWELFLAVEQVERIKRFAGRETRRSQNPGKDQTC